MKKIIIIFLLFASASACAQVRSLIGTDTVSLSKRINEIDVFLIAGQSNAKAPGDSSLSPKVKTGTAYQYYQNIIQAATDPIGGASTGTGTMWTAFAINYWNKTSRKICFVPAAVSGSSMAQGSSALNATWDTAGTLYAASKNLLTAATDSLINRGYTPVFKGILWVQGEADAIDINNSVTTLAIYKAAFRKMIHNYRTDLQDSIPFYIWRTGTDIDVSDVGFAAVRQGEEDVADSMYNTVIVYWGAIDFSSRGFLNGDNLHYNQSGLNEAGYFGSECVMNVGRGVFNEYIFEKFGVAMLGSTQTWTGANTFPGFTTTGNIAVSGTANIGTNAAPVTDMFTTNIKGATGSNLIMQSNAGTNAVVFRRSTTEDFRQAASTGNILIGTTTDVPTSKLTVASTTQGFLPPRMTATQASAISSPAQGLMLFVTSTNGTFTAIGWWGYNGSAWEKLNN